MLPFLGTFKQLFTRFSVRNCLANDIQVDTKLRKYWQLPNNFLKSFVKVTYSDKMYYAQRNS